MREKIVRAAEARFRHYGYEKTTVADIAKDLKVSTAYVYKFYESKLALNEAVAVDVLARIDAALWATARGGGSAEVACAPSTTPCWRRASAASSTIANCTRWWSARSRTTGAPSPGTRKPSQAS
jgi:AcrR family transcriptional regulator